MTLYPRNATFKGSFLDIETRPILGSVALKVLVDMTQHHFTLPLTQSVRKRKHGTVLAWCGA